MTTDYGAGHCTLFLLQKVLLDSTVWTTLLTVTRGTCPLIYSGMLIQFYTYSSTAHLDCNTELNLSQTGKNICIDSVQKVPPNLLEEKTGLRSHKTGALSENIDSAMKIVVLCIFYKYLKLF